MPIAIKKINLLCYCYNFRHTFVSYNETPRESVNPPHRDGRSSGVCYGPVSAVSLSQVGILLKWLNAGLRHDTIAQGL